MATDAAIASVSRMLMYVLSAYPGTQAKDYMILCSAGICAGIPASNL